MDINAFAIDYARKHGTVSVSQLDDAIKFAEFHADKSLEFGFFHESETDKYNETWIDFFKQRFTDIKNKTIAYDVSLANPL